MPDRNDGRVHKTLVHARNLLARHPEMDVMDAISKASWEARSFIRPASTLAVEALMELGAGDSWDAARAWQIATSRKDVLATFEEAIRRVAPPGEGAEVTAAARERVRAFLDARKPLAATDGAARDIIISVATDKGPVHLTISDLETVLDGGRQ